MVSGSVKKTYCSTKDSQLFKNEINEVITGIASGNEIDVEPLLIKENEDVEKSTGVSKETPSQAGKAKAAKDQARGNDLYFTNRRVGNESVEQGIIATSGQTEQVRQRGLLSRAKGNNGFRIGKSSVDDVYTGFITGKFSEAKAYAIANGVPNKESAQMAVIY